MSNENLLLTVDEIQEIERTAANSPELRLENVINFFGNGHKTIYKISPVKGLIFIKGNSETGFEHIHARHEFWSTNPYWKENPEGKTKLGDPSRFNKSSIPIIDYILLGDAIFSNENKNTDKNHDPSRFDMYSGEYTEQDGSKSVYHLLTYKDTKIVHTLYPQSQKYNLKRPDKFHFSRGTVSAEETPAKSLFEIKIPYLNSENKTVYSILIRKHTELKQEKAFVLIHANNSEPESFVYVGERPIHSFLSPTHELVTYQHADLRTFERIILDLDKKNNGI